MTFKLAYILPLTLLLGACQAPALLSTTQAATAYGARQAESTDLYPTLPGSRWNYVLQQKQEGAPDKERAMTVSITSRKASADGGYEAVLDRNYEGWAPPSTRVLVNGERVSLSRLSDPADGPSLTVLRFPVKEGASWKGRPLEQGNSETVVVRGIESLSLPAGDFKAQRMDHQIRYVTGSTDTLSYWYAPGVGVVKMIERSTLIVDGKPLHLEVTGLLKDYRLGSP